VGKLATAKALDGWDMHGLLYEIAFAQGDAAGMAEQVSREKGKSTEDWMLEYEACSAAAAGKLGRARALFERAIAAASAQGADAGEEISDFNIDYIEMLADLGMKDEAQRLANGATGLAQNDEGSFVLAKAGIFEKASALAAALGTRYPNSTRVNDYFRPMTAAEIALGQGRPDDAIAALQPALSLELTELDVPSLLGEAYLNVKQPAKAADEYRKVLANRGVDALSPLYALAWLGLARALRMEGRLHESGAVYAQLFAFWKDADKNLPVLQNARREYDQLQASH
jgi:predicted Zn-dependent protease